jgi:pyrroline-5-carboxylate reductase
MNLLFVGGGNMASALLGGLVENAAGVTHIHVIEPTAAAREALSARYAAALNKKKISFSTDAACAPDAFVAHRVATPAHTSSASSTTSNSAVSPASSASSAAALWVILAVKPQQMQSACVDSHASVRTCLAGGKVLSIAAGISTQALANWCGNDQIVRAMPNTPALVNRGITGLFAGQQISAATRDQAGQLMSAVGQVVWVDDESLMDAVTALSGSGPAYVFRFIEALAVGGQALGLSAAQSETLAVETLEGALALLKSSGETPAALREKVTSKGGTTAAALASLDRDQFMTVVAHALVAARDRGAEMAKEFQ